MPVSRRELLHVLGSGLTGPPASWSGALLAARGLEAHLAEAQQNGRAARALSAPAAGEIRISSNENPLGPGKVALDAILGKFPEAGRYPFNSTPGEGDLVAALAAKYKAKPENIVLGAGSTEILKSAMRAFTSPTRSLVTASPTFENCTNLAKQFKHPFTEVKVDSNFRLDVEPM